MKERGTAVLLVGSSEQCPDLAYLTGLRITDPVVLLVEGRGLNLVVPPLERGRAVRVAPGAVVWTPEELGVGGAARRRLSGWALGLLRRRGVRAVRVPPFFPLGVAEALERAGIRVRASRESLFPRRQVKAPAELAHIREAQQAAVIAMRAAVGLLAEAQPDSAGFLRQGSRRLLAQDVRGAIRRVLLDRDCFAREVIVACGAQAADPHEQGDGPLRAGESIVIDIFPQHLGTGYWGDLTRTVVRGTPSAALRRMYAAVRAAQQAALAGVKAGVKAASVHRRAVEEFRRRGFETRIDDGRPTGFIHGTGHGVGLEIHEKPVVGLAPGYLRSGQVITVEPGLYYPEIGGVRIEDTIVVTRHGWRYLAPCEKKFEI